MTTIVQVCTVQGKRETFVSFWSSFKLKAPRRRRRKYDLGLKPPPSPAPPLGNKTDPEPLSPFPH